jgi:hypothetical protein
MFELNLIEEEKKARTYKEYTTYVFVQTYSNLYNGYIAQVVDSEVFMFIDDEVPQPFPIRFDSLIAPIVPSKKKGNDFNNGRKGEW